MMTAALCIALAYAIGSIPVPYFAGRLRGVDLRVYGSGNVGTSNVWESVSKTWVVPVGLVQVAQGLVAVLVARGFDQGGGVQVTAGIAGVVAHNWNPWLGFQGGRGIGPAIGVMIAMSWPVLVVFAVISLAGVALRRIPESMLIAILAMPFVAFAAGEEASVVAGFAALAAVLLIKRVLANDAPGPQSPRPAVWLTRLVSDRDIPDREVWVHRAPIPATDHTEHNTRHRRASDRHAS